MGSLALALTAGAQQYNDRKPERAKAQQRTANVRAARPANNHAMMGARHYNSAAQTRQRSYGAPRAGSNFVANRNARLQGMRERNFQRNQEFRGRTNAAFNRERNVAVNRTRNFDVNRSRNANEFRARNNMAVNRDRNFAVNRNRNAAFNRDRNFAVDRTQNAAFYRRGNVRITNNWHSDAFRGQRYWAFRNYHREWHDRGWWRSHYDRIIFVNNGWYYWNAGYWYPAWGYAPYVSYVYDGPIYGYNGWTPDRVTVDVQEQLQRAGYYDGPIDGVLGPMTREAIAAFQADNGLAVTSAIDEPTLATLGIA
jgi:glycosyltransferase involved in cell wall biosynthesis